MGKFYKSVTLSWLSDNLICSSTPSAGCEISRTRIPAFEAMESLVAKLFSTYLWRMTLAANGSLMVVTNLAKLSLDLSCGFEQMIWQNLSLPTLG